MPRQQGGDTILPGNSRQTMGSPCGWMREDADGTTRSIGLEKHSIRQAGTLSFWRAKFVRWLRREKEPALVLVKPVSAEAAESNLLVLTASGRQLSFLLRADPAGPKPVDFVMAYGQAGSFLVGESAIAGSEVANPSYPSRETILKARGPVL